MHMHRHGFDHDPEAQAALRKGISDIHWYRETLMVFRRRPGGAAANGARRGGG